MMDIQTTSCKPVSCYCRLILRYPYVLLGVQLALCILCLVLTLVLRDLPDFHDPRLGFEVRGTEISNRLHAYELLLKETITDPTLLVHSKRTVNSTAVGRPSNWTTNSLLVDVSQEAEEFDEADDGERQGIKQNDRHYFCDSPRPEYAKIVFESVDGKTLFTAEKLHSMCHHEISHFRSHQEFRSSCVYTSDNRHCCRSWSLGNYIALIANKTSCESINKHDVKHVLKILRKCSAAFRDNHYLPAECWDPESQKSPVCVSAIPATCRRPSSAVYHMLYHLTDTAFLHTSKVLRYAVTFLPIAAGLGAQNLYKAVEYHNPVDDGLTRVTAIDFGIKQDLFDKYLIADTLWFCVSLVVILVAVWLYTTSLFLTVSSFLVIFFSIVVAYFVYTFVFEINFFPFMNLLVVVILIGNGVDDVFVYVSAWSQAKSERDSPTPDQLIVNSFGRSTPSAFASSATTAAAFFAGAVASNVTVLRCFGVFAGITVVCHFVILAIAMPALIVVHEKWCSMCIQCCGKFSCNSCKFCCCFESFVSCLNTFVQCTIPCFVVKLRFFILPLFGAVGVASAFVVFVYPKLELPTSNEFQLFSASHPFEVYDLKIKPHLWFTHSTSFDVPTLPMTVVWGVKPIDNGNHLNPFDNGNIEYDERFDISSSENRKFLASFCRSLRQTRYYQLETGLQLTNCFVENFERFMRRNCESIDGRQLRPCCGGISVTAEVFHTCLREYIPHLSQSAVKFLSDRQAGPRFSKHSGRLVGVIVEFQSNESFSLNYTRVGDFFSYMDSQINSVLSSAPAGLRNGFFISHLAFYDLQRELANDIPAATGLALAVASVVALVVTLNPLLALYAMLTVALSICVTFAILVFLGWQLNVVESVTVSVAVGLSVDFALHYSVAYRFQASTTDREQRVLNAAKRISSPVVMSAGTTFLVGSLVMPSTILAYRQLGSFLMIVIAVSWVYTTFFLQSLLSIAGPRGNCGQLHCRCFSDWLSSCFDMTRRKSMPMKRAREPVYISSEISTNVSRERTSESDHLTSVTELDVVKADVAL